MKLNPIINSLLENDLYKISMTQCIYHQFSGYKTTWAFKCRNKDVVFTPEMVQEIKDQIQHYCGLQFTEDELTYLDSIPWIKGSYVDFLRLWKPRYADFEITTDDPSGLTIETRGSWLNTSFYEVPVLAIVNEVYFRMNYNYDELIKSFEENLDAKIQKLIDGTYHIGNFSEFGLRRRLSAEAQDMAVRKLMENNGKFHKTDKLYSNLVGTSNIYLAKKYNIKPMGTMAHELIMGIGQGNPKHNAAYSNYFTMEAWVKEYGILNGIMLTDTITTDCFLRDFDLTFATLFSGVRHDSGDPYEWADKMIAHYQKLGINPKTKTLLFSDSLNFEKADKLFNTYVDKTNVAFDIGTHISNHTNVPALNIVMKPIMANGGPVAKLSDNPSKGMCRDQAYIDYLRRCIAWRMEHEK